MRSIAVTVICSLVLAACGRSEPQPQASAGPEPVAEAAEAAVSSNSLKNAYFGDLHLHTALSPDANFFGATLLPEASYRFAMGEKVTYMGRTVQRKEPLDFLAVTDHAEYLGVIHSIKDPDGPYAGTELHTTYTSGDQEALAQAYSDFLADMSSNEPRAELNKEEVIKSNWQIVIDAANRYNDPGKFTAFVGFEWTSMPVNANNSSQNLHRCVVFKGDDVPALPFSSFDSEDPEDLWTYLENARTSGDDVIAVPHNGNISNGLMFDTETLSGEPLTREYAVRRMANEPLFEMMQAKGQSETRPELSTNDEFADYEVFDLLLGSTERANYGTGSYVRQAYGVGQEIQERIGANPFKYGLEAGTDFHSALSSSEENNYPGSHGMQDDLGKDYELILTATESMAGEPPTKVSVAGLTGVWAEENTREAIFDALKRKESFATSGGRIKVRFFAGWGYDSDLIKQDDWVGQAYAAGVPMGGDLSSGAGTPKFVVHALKDPNSGNLDRIQIIKVSSKNGETKEKIVDVVWSDGRQKDANGKLPTVGNTVDIETATYRNTIGSPELIGYWEDTEFDPEAYVTYYARVLEIPTPRWTTYLAAKHVMAAPEGVDATVQERAWTSPIWYTP